MNTKTLNLLFTILCPAILFAQTITGKISDKTNVIPFANVILKDTNNNIISGTTTNNEGSFEVKMNAGNYKIEISYLGYRTWEKQIKVDANLNLGTIILEENAQALNEIIVKTEKRILERKIDRLVFNVEKSIAAVGGNGLDVLKITPGIQLQNGNLSILGKGKTQIMINGRISPLKGDELMSFLSGFSANDIVKIEVITNPPAKYEASGNGGLINIVLKKGIKDSWKNATTISYNQNRYNFTTITNNLFYNKNKISFSGSINATKGGFENSEGLLIDYPANNWEIDVNSKTYKNQFSGRFLIDYALSDKTTFGLQYLGNNTKPDIIGTTVSSIFDNNNTLEYSLVNKGDNIVDTKNHTVNFHLITQLDSLGKNISFDADYFTFNSENSRDFFTEKFNNKGNSEGINSAALNISNQEIKNFSSKIDVDFPMKKINLSYGIKASFTNTKSNVLYYNTLSGSTILDSNRSNKFNYKENVLAAYFSGNTTITNQLKMQFGLRLEDSKTKGVNTEINKETVNKYTKLFPSIYFSYKKNEHNNFGFSYGRRINRPNFNHLNPFRFYINENSYSVGNPFLKPSFSDNFEISHLYKKNLNTSIYLNITTDGFGTVFTSVAENQAQIITKENYFKQYNYGITENFSFNKNSWFKSINSINLLGYYTKFMKDFGAKPKNGVQLYVTSNNTFSLSKKTKLQVNSWYSSQHNRGLYSLGKMFDISLGLQHQFKNNIKLSLLFSDVLNTASLNNYTSTVNDIKQIYRQNESSRNFRVSLSYDFGNKKINVKKRDFGNDDERRRSN
ncbi:Outer membrane receptor proteins, mostly Fe transport [Polaribacter sp. KT25b]|uniref:TonB-dependent receptor domain-containing protein n=1 Tax=Polaribacter sp. KT25b TaxID=1855336 RepID=UPI00087BC5B8|nr:outer membrane beta-barrel family protein [Polaribacter sp. KT25b]SDS54236.1 Outer membrane receptor proteins, mostly Fe transport [Polaribacter sp. KT25b]